MIWPSLVLNRGLSLTRSEVVRREPQGERTGRNAVVLAADGLTRYCLTIVAVSRPGDV